MDRSNQIILVPYEDNIEKDCYDPCRELEANGVHADYRGGCSAIDIARNQMLSDALHHGYESMLFVDSDINFYPADALKLFDNPEAVVAGLYPKKNQINPEVACTFPQETKSFIFGDLAPGLYPLFYAPAGFLRVHAWVLREIIDILKLPLCANLGWPFFMPMILDHGLQVFQYLSEDLAFSHRCRMAGFTPMADTTIRLFHVGKYSYTWEECVGKIPRYQNFEIHFK